MESHRTPGGRRSVLLPSEVQLCEALGITADDYWTFVALLHESKERGKEYELIPDIRAGDGGLTVAIISLVIGLASTALSLLLRPSVPGQSKAPGSIRTPDLNGRDKYLPTAGFDSLQNLANLGDIIPLIYCNSRFNQGQYVGGGARVNSTLLWSHMLSKGRYQELRALLLFGHGKIGEEPGKAPTFASYAIGESLLNNYNKGKIELFYRQDGGRINKTQNRYSESLMPVLPGSQQPFEVIDFSGESVPSFSGARTPATQAQFGLYSPLPNGMRYKVPYQVTLVYDDASSDSKDEVRAKARKIAAEFPRYCHVETVAGVSYDVDPNPRVVQKGDIITYVIGTNKYTGDTFESNGAQDIIQAQDRTRYDADAALAVGDSYMIGDALCVCYQKDNSPWYPESPNPVRAYFRVVEPGGNVMCGPIEGTDEPGARTTVQRAAIGTVTNNRRCHRTDILLKSTVFRRINGFANVNSQVDDDVIQDFQEDGTQFSLGSMQLFNKRISVFSLGVRRAGTTKDFTQILNTNGQYPAWLCVLGRTPEPQYNTISVNHPDGEFEFRLYPVSGAALELYFRNEGIEAYLLDAVSNSEQKTTIHGSSLPDGSQIKVQIIGRPITLNQVISSNLEWVLGLPPNIVETGGVLSFSATEGVGNDGLLPNLDITYVEPEERLDVAAEYYVSSVFGTDNNFYWGDANDPVGSSDNNVVFNGDYKYTIGTQTVGGSPNLKSIIRERRTLQEKPSIEEVISVAGGNITGGSGTGLELFTFQWPDGASHWSIKNPGTGYRDGETINLTFTSSQTNPVSVQIFVNKDVSQNNLRVNDAIQDYVVYDAEDTSAQQQPEHEIVNLNEIVDDVNEPQYEDLAYAGLRLASGKEWSTFSQVSAFFREGIVGTKADRTFGTISTVPDIAYDLLTNTKYGAGAFLTSSSGDPSNQIDRESMAKAAKFCTANNFYWDGVIAERLNIRQWIFEQSAFCMLSFIVKGGKFSLYPDVPFKNSGEIDYTKDIGGEIKTLFTDGNIRGLQTSFLSPEERQPFKAVCIWRRDELDGFPDKRVLVVRLERHAGGSEDDPEETFDMSQFCTSQEHAAKFAKYALKTRTLVDHGVKFETTPQSALTLEPGDYFDLVTTVSHPTTGTDSGERLRNGSIDKNGYINGVDIENGSLDIVYWKPGTDALYTDTINVTDGVVRESFAHGSVFTRDPQSNPVRRTYKAESITYGEDGLIEVAGSYVPRTSSGSLAVLDWGIDDFREETG